MRLFVATLSLCLAAAACARGETAASASVRIDTLPGGVVRTLTDHPIDSGRWSLTLERTISPAEGDSGELISPQDLAFADDGSLVVVESNPAHLKVFGPDGVFIRRLGRDGSGPGEFRTAYIGIRGDTVVVQDARSSRAVMLNWRTGAPIGGTHTACCYFAPIHMDERGRATIRTIAQPPESTPLQSQGFIRVTLATSAAETLWVTERRPKTESKAWLVREGALVRMGVPVPFQPVAQYAVDPNGDFVTGWTGEYMLRVTRTGRDTIALFGRPAAPVPVTAAEKTSIAEQRIASTLAADRESFTEATLRAAFDPTMIADVRPAYEWLYVDAAGRRWVRLSSADTTAMTFDLFDREGRWLDIVRVGASGWPRSPWSSVAWGKDRAAVSLDGVDGRPAILVYRIVRR